MSYTIKQLRSLRAVIASGGFGRAANDLGLSQPVISGHIRELEEQLGAKLINRTTRHLSLTSVGESFLAEIEQGLDMLDDAVANVLTRGQMQATTLRLAAPPMLAATLLPPVIASFTASHPHIRVTLKDLPTGPMMSALKAGEVDAAIGTLADSDDVGFRQVLLRDRLMLFTPAKSRLAGADTVEWTDLVGQSVIAQRVGSGIRALIDREVARRGLQIPFAYEVHNLETAIALVEAGLGVAILPSYVAAGLSARPVHRVELGGAPVTREIVLITSSAFPSPEPLPAFLRDMQRHVRSLDLAVDDR
ncbi:MAG: LysR family transcriptional regulator [Devosiaceae bacterium]|nr:LysR family transcriptional regulator [Devosiaceae bacterium MH13]